MKTKTNKSSKLRDFICVICKKPFQNYLSPSDIKRGSGKVCSSECKGKLNSLKKKNGSNRICVVCGKEFYCSKSDAKWHNPKFCNWECSIKKQTKMGRIGGRMISSDGYVMLYIDRKQIKEHRYNYEQFLGRKLLSSEIIHHKDFNKLNNNISNLQLVTRSEHNIIHKFLRS